MQSLFTPGHEVDHVSYYLEDERMLFTGDCILGAPPPPCATCPPICSRCALLSRYPHDTICPGHGPVVPPPRGAELVRWYIDHRLEREQQVLAALGKGLGTIEAITRDVYPADFPPDCGAAQSKMSPPTWKNWSRKDVSTRRQRGIAYRIQPEIRDSLTAGCYGAASG